MHLDKIHAISNFKNNVIRNTPILNQKDDALADLVDDQFDISVAKKSIDKSRISHFRKIEYHAVDYVFNQELCFKSRFTDGSFPVWYGSLDQETTFYETAFHWYQTIIQDMYYDEDAPIIINRSIFVVDCHAMLVDLRKLTQQIPELIDKNTGSYNVTQVLSKEIYNHGQSGIYTYSARKAKGENIAIYNRKSLNKVEYLNDVQYIYDFKKSKIQIINKQFAQAILEIEG